MRNLEEFAGFIECFLSDETGPFDFDDATSIPAKTALLRRVQAALWEIHHRYPSEEGFCSRAGREKMLELAEHLRAGEDATAEWLNEFEPL